MLTELLFCMEWLRKASGKVICEQRSEESQWVSLAGVRRVGRGGRKRSPGTAVPLVPLRKLVFVITRFLERTLYLLVK